MRIKKDQQYSSQEVLEKLMRYCSYQERSELEVKIKLREFHLKEALNEKIIARLKKDNFLDERRFAIAFVRGKISLKRWGLFKVREGLQQKGVSSSIIREALKTIDAELYQNNLEYLVTKSEGKNAEQLYRYLIAKGYESDLIKDFLRSKKLMN